MIHHQSLELGLIVCVWYGASMLAATSSKTLLTEGTLDASSLSLTQMLISSILALGSSVVSNGTVKHLYLHSVKDVLHLVILSIVFTLAFWFLNLAYTSMSTSLANTQRSMEPLYSLLLLKLSSNDVVNWNLIVAIIPIVFGAMLASYGNATFSWWGFCYCSLANLFFALRMFMYKHIKAKLHLDHTTMFFYTSGLSAILLSMFNTSMGLSPSLPYTVYWNGAYFFLYLQLSFVVLSYVSLVSHSVLNAFRRPAVILFDVFTLDTKVSFINMVGVTIACLGVAVYSLIQINQRK